MYWNRLLSLLLSLILIFSLPVFAETSESRADFSGLVNSFGDESPRVRKFWESGLRANVPAETLDTWLLQLQQLRGQGLPTDPFLTKAIEGFSKKVSTEKIVASFEEIRGRIELAKDLADRAILRGAKHDTNGSKRRSIAGFYTALEQTSYSDLKTWIEKSTPTHANPLLEDLAKKAQKHSAVVAMIKPEVPTIVSTAPMALSGHSSAKGAESMSGNAHANVETKPFHPQSKLKSKPKAAKTKRQSTKKIKKSVKSDQKQRASKKTKADNKKKTVKKKKPDTKKTRR